MTVSPMAAIFARLVGGVRAGSLTLDSAAERLLVAELGDRINALDAHRISELVTRAKRAIALAAEHPAGSELWNPYGSAGDGDLAAIQAGAEVDAVLDDIRASQRREDESRLARWGVADLATSDAQDCGS